MELGLTPGGLVVMNKGLEYEPKYGLLDGVSGKMFETTRMEYFRPGIRFLNFCGLDRAEGEKGVFRFFNKVNIFGAKPE